MNLGSNLDVNLGGKTHNLVTIVVSSCPWGPRRPRGHDAKIRKINMKWYEDLLIIAFVIAAKLAWAHSYVLSVCLVFQKIDGKW